eukprot:gb/GECH01012049.1/.p1 GENE.gb/GECH01012049.1/~~gb/GECH01012049.1/.p1  ORF type:complete len:128 (+),score=19.25 gb/GECH01012049.1/:1-384(+)
MFTDTLNKEQAQKFNLLPSSEVKFKADTVRPCIQKVMKEKLEGASYKPDNVTQWTKEIADEVRDELKRCGFERYKYIVNVVIGEQRGAGIKFGMRCFWDKDTDGYVTETFTNNDMFCVATVFGLYLY